MDMEERFRRSALWIEARHGDGLQEKTDDEVFAGILHDLRETATRTNFYDKSPKILRTIPHIERSFGGPGIGNKLTCDYCGVTVFTTDPDRFAEFIVLHAGCEVESEMS